MIAGYHSFTLLRVAYEISDCLRIADSCSFKDELPIKVEILYFVITLLPMVSVYMCLVTFIFTFHTLWFLKKYFFTDFLT